MSAHVYITSALLSIGFFFWTRWLFRRRFFRQTHGIWLHTSVRPKKHRRRLDPHIYQPFRSRHLIRFVQERSEHDDQSETHAAQNTYADKVEIVILGQVLPGFCGSNHPGVDNTAKRCVPREFRRSVESTSNSWPSSLEHVMQREESSARRKCLDSTHCCARGCHGPVASGNSGSRSKAVCKCAERDRDAKQVRSAARCGDDSLRNALVSAACLRRWRRSRSRASASAFHWRLSTRRRPIKCSKSRVSTGKTLAPRWG